MNAGVMCVLGFVAAAAARDVYFGSVFQGYRFFEVVLVAFGLATVLFLALVALRSPGQFRAIRLAWRETLWANLGTAAAWLSYFYALKLLEPSVVNTIHTGIGPVALVWLGAAGLHIARPAQVRPAEHVWLFGIVLSLAAMASVVLAGLSGLAGRGGTESVLGLFLAASSGVIIATTSAVTKRMHERGVTPEGVLATRFIAIVAVSAAFAFAGEGQGRSLGDTSALGTVALAALALIVAPLYLLQVGIARTSAVSTWVLMALGPSLVFFAEFADDRIATSPWTLGCIAGYTVCALGVCLARSYERPAPIDAAEMSKGRV